MRTQARLPARAGAVLAALALACPLASATGVPAGDRPLPRAVTLRWSRAVTYFPNAELAAGRLKARLGLIDEAVRAGRLSPGQAAEERADARADAAHLPGPRADAVTISASRAGLLIMREERGKPAERAVYAGGKTTSVQYCSGGSAMVAVDSGFPSGRIEGIPLLPQGFPGMAVGRGLKVVRSDSQTRVTEGEFMLLRSVPADGLSYWARGNMTESGLGTPRRAARIELVSADQRCESWAYSDYRPFAGGELPGKVEKTDYWGAGRFPARATTEQWRLQTATATALAPAAFAPENWTPQLAHVEIRTQASHPTFMFQKQNGSYAEQSALADAAPTPPSRSSSVAPYVLGVLVLLIIWRSCTIRRVRAC